MTNKELLKEIDTELSDLNVNRVAHYRIQNIMKYFNEKIKDNDKKDSGVRTEQRA